MQARLRERASGNVSVAVALAIVLTIVAINLNESWAFTGAQVACYSIAALSLVLLVGASGQISMCQVTFMGLSTIMLAKLTEQGVPWGIALLGGILTSAFAGLLISLTAFRLRGLFLALITFAFAYAAMVLVFRNEDVISFAGLFVERPSFFGWDLDDDRNYMIFCSGIVVLCIVAVGALLNGPWGRALQTLSAGDSVADVSGLPVRQWKMAVFTLSAALAGLAGGLLGAANLTVTGDSFLPQQSIFLLVFAVVGGITTPTGAVMAGVIAQAGDDILGLVIDNPGAWSLVLFGIMAIDTTIRYPAGFGGLLPKEIPGLRALGKRLRRLLPGREPPVPATGGGS
jgi:branched-chain amino acid transport system permease protein